MYPVLPAPVASLIDILDHIEGQDDYENIRPCAIAVLRWLALDRRNAPLVDERLVRATQPSALTD